ncbi:uncharacterized protein, partial [Panulirus ornatus]|uniref:uncharacterized protein n=1 Tax=Panulirus ornatus TaxID=150431 RepID=UPI003A8A2A9A
ITQTRRLSELLLEDGGRELITYKSRHKTTPSRVRQNTTPTRSKLGTTPTRSRKKRATLVWPSGSIFEVEFYLTIPITAPAGVTIPFTLDVPYRFKLPNLTTSNFLGRGQSHKDDRFHLYGVIEGLFDKFGADGRACVLRAVCEHAQTHLMGAGILGEVISTILVASSASSSSEEMHEYVTAEFYGKSHGNCRSMYPTCPISLFSWLD